MNKLIYILFIILIASCKKETPAPENIQEFTIHSASVGADYNVKIALPENYNSSQKYTVIYVSDSDDNFNLVAKKCREAGSQSSAPGILVAGIGYGRERKNDYTPTKAAEGDGGAPQFMMFMQKELIPKMEAEYGADTSRENRVILGHSFGGLLATYAFTNYNSLFGNYIILSPSLWYDNEVMLRMEQENRSSNSGVRQLVFMGIGQMENMGRMQAPFEAFYQRLKNNYSAIKIEKHLEPHLDHVGSRNPNIEAALDYYFQNRY